MNRNEQFVILVQTGALAAASKSDFEPGTGALKAMAAVVFALRIIEVGRLPDDLTVAEAARELLLHSGLLGLAPSPVPAWLTVQ